MLIITAIELEQRYGKKIKRSHIDLGFGFSVKLVNVPMTKVKGEWTPAYLMRGSMAVVNESKNSWWGAFRIIQNNPGEIEIFNHNGYYVASAICSNDSISIVGNNSVLMTQG